MRSSWSNVTEGVGAALQDLRSARCITYIAMSVITSDSEPGGDWRAIPRRQALALAPEREPGHSHEYSNMSRQTARYRYKVPSKACVMEQCKL